MLGKTFSNLCSIAFKPLLITMLEILCISIPNMKDIFGITIDKKYPAYFS